ncbi:hypothetical protein GTA08_BOTSDO00586 [Neofusicoccum parvum]|uniref:Uncharacterized protein n=1 Tax=Neofusicoccum parvum TaxID=310453 RepID=A0ACB5SHI7_9PEZI|nr:hypothetical protein GTA08_BOTSDO00586 [Neofusicoccum parvum]
MSTGPAATMPPAPRIPLTLIVAATPSLGIGANGALPWPPLKKEMGYFARVTKRVPATPVAPAGGPVRKNAVIMGRKTWESIPPRFRPLKDRINIVVSREPGKIVGGGGAGTGSAAPNFSRHLNGANVAAPPAAAEAAAEVNGEQVVAAASVQGAVAKLRELDDAGVLGRAYVIGGAQLYKAALEMEEARYVLLTRMGREYACDTTFPVDVVGKGEGANGWVRRGNDVLGEFVGEEVEKGSVREVAKVDGVEEEVQFEFCLFEKEG